MADPIHWDEEVARASKFGGLVAPQSIPVCMDCGHGVPLVQFKVRLKNQDDVTVVDATADVQLPIA